MNPVFQIMTFAAVGIASVTGLAVLPPDSQLDAPLPTVALYSWEEIQPAEMKPEGHLRSPQTTATAPQGYCPTLIAPARAEGFSAADTALLTRIAWLESRCQTDALGDLDRGVSWGILQIHGPTWCEPSRYWPDGYLQAALIVESCADLLDPVIAVKAAKVIVREGGFAQWSTYEKAVGR